MKRMTENAISYYTVTADDIKNITVEAANLFKYTPSQEFLDVLHEFKAVLIVDWSEVAPNIWHLTGAKVSVLYPVNKVTVTDEDDLAYSYYAGLVDNKQMNPSFIDINGEYKINWNLT